MMPNISIYYYPTLDMYLLTDTYHYEGVDYNVFLVTDYKTVIDLKKLINDIMEFNISYERMRWILKRWYQDNQNNQSLIEANKDILCRNRILDRQTIISYYGEPYAYEVLDEYDRTAKQCRLKAYSFGESIIRNWLDEYSMITIFYSVVQYKLDISYKEYGIHGLNYGDTVEGIMDFIEGTNSFQGIGINDMNLNIIIPGRTKQDLINKLKQYLWEFDFSS